MTPEERDAVREARQKGATDAEIQALLAKMRQEQEQQATAQKE